MALAAVTWPALADANAPAASGLPRPTDGYGLVATDRSEVDAPGELTLRLDLEYARSPLRLPFGGEFPRVVPNEVGIRAGLSVGLWHHLEAGVWLPVTLDTYSPAGQTLAPNAAGASTRYDVGAGDLRLFLKISALSRRHFGLGLVAAAVLASGDRNAFRSDGQWGADVRLVFDVKWRWLSLAFNAGVRGHDTIVARDENGAELLKIGPELTWAAAFAAALHARVALALELAGSESMTSFDARARTAEALLSLRVMPAAAMQLFVGVGRALDPDSARGDDVRVIAGLAWHPLGARAKPVEVNVPQETAPQENLPPPPQVVEAPPSAPPVEAPPPTTTPPRPSLGELPLVRFPRNQGQLDAAGLQAAGRLADLLGFHREVKRVRLEGHASSDERRPDELSGERAQAVLRALAQRGVEPERLSAVGYGAARPVSAQAAENRRVECIIVDQPAEAR